MEQIIEHINVNLVPGGVPSICHASQYDEGRIIRAHLIDGILPHTLSGTETIILSMRKPDLSRHVYTLENSSSDYIDIVTTSDMCSVAGESECEFIITDSSNVIGTANFKMKIESDAYGDSLVVKSVSGPIASFKTDLAENLIKLDVDLEPVQDLHGYDGAWPAGGEKNRLPPNGTDGSTTINGITFTALNGVYTIKGTSTEAASISYPLKASVDMSPSTQKIVFLNTEGNTGVSLYFKRNGSNIHYWQMHPANRVASNWTDTGNELIDEITIAVSANKTVNMTISPMFLLLSETSETPFEPYSNICPISGHDSAQLFRTGKNLLDTRQESIPQYADGSGVYANVTYTPNDDGSITINGTSTGSSVLFFNPVTLNPVTSYPFPTWKYTNNRYTFSVTDGWGLVTGDAYIQATVKKIKDDSIVSRQRLTASVLTRSFTVREDEYIADAFVRLSSGASASNINIKIQLEVGFAATDYEPYESDPTPITVYFGQTVYKGKLYSEQRKVLVTHVCETYDGSSDEEWTRHSATSVRYGFRIYFQYDKKPTTQSIDEMLSSVIPLRKSSETTSVDDDIITCRSTTYLHKIFYIFAPPSKISTVEELRAFLANEPETVMYPLAEPFYIDLSQEQTEDVDRAAIASFETNIQRPLETAEHYFSCSQAEGTPTPDSPIPITGVSEITAYRTGKNLIDTDDFFNFQSWEPNLVTVDEFPTNYSNRGYKLPTKVGETYTISFGIDENDIPRYVYLCKTDGITSTRVTYITTGSALFNRTFTFTSDGSLYYLRSGSMIDQSAFEEQIGKIDFVQLELGSTATPYEPYSGESITVSLGGTYYGGKLVQSEDGSRKIVLDKAFTKINALTWAYVPSFTYFNAYPTNLKQNSDAGKKLDGLTSDIYTNRTASQAGSGDIDLSIAGYQTAIRIKDKTYTDVTTWLTAVGDHDIVYPLETPIEVSLPDGDPLTAIAGENNVYCNTGDTALTYYYNMVADPIRIPALVGTNNVYSDAGDVDVEYYTTLEGGND